MILSLPKHSEIEIIFFTRHKSYPKEVFGLPPSSPSYRILSTFSAYVKNVPEETMTSARFDR